MAKRDKQSKRKRNERRARQKQLAREEKRRQQRALLDDMRYFAERGKLASEKALGSTMFDALYQSAEWRHEPEFAGLAFDVGSAGLAMNEALKEGNLTDESIAQSSDQEQEEKGFEIAEKALGQVITPGFKQGILKGLARFRQRLRAERKWETLANVAAVEMALQTGEEVEGGAGLWSHCMLVYRLFVDALKDYERLTEAAENVLKTTAESLGGTSPEEFVAGPPSQSTEETLRQAVEATPGLSDFLQDRTGAMVSEAFNLLSGGKIDLGLYTLEEVAALNARVAAAVARSGLARSLVGHPPDQMSEKVLKRLANVLFESATQQLREMDTSERRTALYSTARQRLGAMAKQKDASGLSAGVLLALLDESEPLDESDLMIRAMLGEFRLRGRQAMESAAQTEGEEQPEGQPPGFDQTTTENYEGEQEQPDKSATSAKPGWLERLGRSARRTLRQRRLRP